MAKILVVEDDVGLSFTLTEWLEREHYSVDAVHTGDDALHYLQSFEYDLLILDWQLPGVTGVELCKHYRLKSAGAVLMLTGKASINNKMRGFDAGADDYLTKPFDFRELMIRIRALLKRSPEVHVEILVVGDLHIDKRNRSVKKRDQHVNLTPREYDVLEFFLKNPNQVISLDNLLKRVWESDSEATEKAVYSCINRLRKNLDSQNKNLLIKTVHGRGYVCEM